MLLTREEVFSKVAEIISNHFEIDKDKKMNSEQKFLTKTLKKLKQLELQLITLWKTTKLNKKRCTSNLLVHLF